MALKEIAVEGCTLTVTGGGPGTATITSSPSTKVKCEGKKIYTETLGISISGCMSGNCVQTAPVSANISADAKKVESEGNLVMRVNDKEMGIIINGLIGGLLPCSFTVDVEITDAGQTKVKAE